MYITLPIPTYFPLHVWTGFEFDTSVDNVCVSEVLV